MDSSSSSSPCTLDRQFADQIAALLAPPSPESIKEYFDVLIETRKCNGLSINLSNKNEKAVYATKNFEKGELVLKDRSLFAVQHSSNKVDCLVCSYCFHFIGSIELQIGRKLYLKGLGLSANEKCHDDSCTSEPNNATRYSFNNENGEMCSSSSGNSENNPVPDDVVQSLINGSLLLPYTKNFTMPPVFNCPGECDEEHYCSKFCAESDWDSFHSLLCTGKNQEPAKRNAILNFIEHANGTNDIFILAAKVIAFTISRFKRLKKSCSLDSSKNYMTDRVDMSLLNEAWKPISMGFKKRWWECISLPDDVDEEDEESFRKEIRDLAFDSLQLLKEAIFDPECAPLFSLEIYGHIISMFELNNLDLVVASPVEDYFIYIDDLPYPQKEGAKRNTQGLLYALGDDYSVYCQGTGFYPLQSCMNHSCCPNAKAFKREEDTDGHAIIIAQRPISTGEEITISYIDEDRPYEERQALLADYGFQCICPRCLQEQS